MTKRDYSEYQKNVINNYYDNMDTIMLTKLGELVSELFLAETATKKEKLWDRAHKAMLKLKVAPMIIEHIMAKRDVNILAKNLNDWLSGSAKKGR
jgi:hypothetical protein